MNLFEIIFVAFSLLLIKQRVLVTAYTIEKVAEAVELGEGPHWDEKCQKLFYVDLTGQRVMRYDPETGDVTSAYFSNGPVGVVIPIEDSPDKFIVGSDRSIFLLTWDGESNTTNPKLEKLGSVDTDRDDTRINDGKCDPSGRFWVGTMSYEINKVIKKDRGSLYRIDSLEDPEPKKILAPLWVSNGLAWNSAKDTMYFIDSNAYQVWSFDYDDSDGSISNLKVIFDLKKKGVVGSPDGMTIDADDNLWVALFDGFAVIQINPRTGKLMRTIRLPVQKITSAAFGGPNLDVLYVTSANFGLTDEEIEAKPDSGALYAIRGLGVKGRVATNFRLN